MNLKLFSPRQPDAIVSAANLITLVRVAVCMILFMMAIAFRNPVYNYVGFFFHWIVDFIDGLVARKFKQETLLGAELDIIADRLEVILFYAIFLHFRPEVILPAALYLIDYAFIDFYLSYQFIKFDIISPNYFDKVDRRVYLLNYSPAGKFSNSSVVTLSLIFLPQLRVIITLYACGLIAVKTYSVLRLLNKRYIVSAQHD